MRIGACWVKGCPHPGYHMVTSEVWVCGSAAHTEEAARHVNADRTEAGVKREVRKDRAGSRDE
jgi:hypothetical protein